MPSQNRAKFTNKMRMYADKDLPQLSTHTYSMRQHNVTSNENASTRLRIHTTHCDDILALLEKQRTDYIHITWPYSTSW